MATAIFTTVPKDFPQGTVAAGYLFTLTEQGGTVLTAVAPMNARTVVIDNVPPGTYDATIALVDQLHNPLFPAVSAGQQFVVVAPVTTVQFDVPDSVSVS